jgi:(p)ppGpp synthase/HD superfamily hydrolase
MSGVLTSSQARRAEAVAFLIAAYNGVAVRPGKGLPHAEAVADVLRSAGYDDNAQLVGLLHDVVEDTPRTVDDVRDEFGSDVAATVGALTEDQLSVTTPSASATCVRARWPRAHPRSTSPSPTRSPRCATR